MTTRRFKLKTVLPIFVQLTTLLTFVTSSSYGQTPSRSTAQTDGPITLENLASDYLDFPKAQRLWARNADSEAMTDTWATEVKARMNFWLSEMHQQLLRRNLLDPEIQLPVPQVRIYESALGAIEGYVKSELICFDLSRTIATGLTRRNRLEKFFLLPQDEGKILFKTGAELSGAKVECRPPPNEEAEAYVLELVRSRSGCSIQKEARTNTYSLDQRSCKLDSKMDPELDGSSHAEGVILQRVEPLIRISASSIRKLSSEAELLMLLAHEASHYYLAHSARNTADDRARYGYYMARLRPPFADGPAHTDFSLVSPFGLDRIGEVSRLVSQGTSSRTSHHEANLRLVEAASSATLSKYSEEVEADEFGLLLLKMVGLSTSSAPSLFQKLLEQRPPRESVAISGYERCPKHFELNTWPPWGPFSDDYPSSCFRKYNSREHSLFLESRYPESPNSHYLMSTEEWKRFQGPEGHRLPSEPTSRKPEINL